MLQRILEQAGRLLPEAKRFPTERKLRGWLEQQRLDRADYVIVSFGKSGRTWLRVMISRIYQRRHGLSDELIEYGNYHRANAALPRVLFTHDNYLRDYTGHGGGKAAFAGKRGDAAGAPSGRHHDVAILSVEAPDAPAQGSAQSVPAGRRLGHAVSVHDGLERIAEGQSRG